MHILMISDVYFPRINGVSTSIQTFREELIAAGHQVTLVVPEYPTKYTREDGIIRIPSRGVLFDPEDRMMVYKKIIKQIPELKKLAIDLVHIHTPFVAHYAGVQIARSLNVRCVVTYHTYFEEYLYHYIPILPKRFLKFLARNFSASQCKQMDGIIVPSTAMQKTLEEYGVSAPKHIIPTGIHPQKFRQGNAAQFLERHSIPSNRPTLLNVSRIAFEKNIDVLLHALQQIKIEIPDVILVLAGEGPAKKALQKLADKLGLAEHVYFVGYLDRDSTLIDCYRCADIFVFSSCTETQGLVLLEAMAAGTPVVSVAEMGTRDIVMGCQAAMVAENCSQHFAEQITSLLQNPKHLKYMRAHTYQSANQWSAKTLAEKMVSFYQNYAGPNYHIEKTEHLVNEHS